MATKHNQVETVSHRILFIRGQKVMLDKDLAELFGVSTKRFNEQVKRNLDRFPSDFMFQLNKDEKAEVVANCDHLREIKYSPYLPRAVTEHGTLMLGNVLKVTLIKSNYLGSALLFSSPDCAKTARRASVWRRTPRGCKGRLGGVSGLTRSTKRLAAKNETPSNSPLSGGERCPDSAIRLNRCFLRTQARQRGSAC